MTGVQTCALPIYHRKSIEQMVAEIQNEGKAVILACGSACPFLAENNLCSIYPTRPNSCVAMQAGDEQCQHARNAAGLLPLLPIVSTD